MKSIRFRRTIVAGGGVAVAAAVAVAAGVVAVAPPASAAIAGLTYVTGETNSNSSSRKGMTLPCPTGTRGLGGGISITGNNQIRIQSIWPTPSGVQFEATEPVEGVSTNWSFTAKAVCAPSTSLPGQAVIGASDQETVLEGGATKRVAAEAQCPAGKGLIGLGAFLDVRDTLFTTNSTRARLTRIEAAMGPDGLASRIRADANAAGYDGVVHIQVTGICVDASQVALDWMQNQTPSDSTNAKDADNACPNRTPTITAGGFGVYPATGQNADFAVGVTRASLGVLPDRVSVVARESTTGTSENWRLIAYRLCVG